MRRNRRRGPILSRAEGSAGSGAGRAEGTCDFLTEDSERYYLGASQSELSNPSTSRSWHPLKTFAYLSIGGRQSNKVADEDVLAILTPIGRQRPERDEGGQRIETRSGWGCCNGSRNGQNPAPLER